MKLCRIEATKYSLGIIFCDGLSGVQENVLGHLSVASFLEARGFVEDVLSNDVAWQGHDLTC